MKRGDRSAIAKFGGTSHHPAMKLIKYFGGESLQLRSSLSAKEVAERINRTAGSSFWPFTVGVVGGVHWGHVRLRFRSSIFEYNAKPVLAGRLCDATGGARLDLKYRAPIWVYFFYSIWYLFLGLIIVGLSSNGMNPELTNGDKVMVFAIFALLLVAPLGMHAIGTRNAESELGELADFLWRTAEATA